MNRPPGQNLAFAIKPQRFVRGKSACIQNAELTAEDAESAEKLTNNWSTLLRVPLRAFAPSRLLDLISPVGWAYSPTEPLAIRGRRVRPPHTIVKNSSPLCALRVPCGESSSASRRARAFTLIEMLVVMGIIILILAVAIPSIRALTGTRSVDAGFNTISAAIAQAREEAVGLQEVHGVMFYLNPSNNKVEAVFVQQTTPPTTPTTPTPTYYLDVTPNRDYVTLPTGVAVQTINAPTANFPDRYLGFNPPSTFGQTWVASSSNNGAQFGGVILFDGNGRLISATYGFKLFTLDSSNSSDPTGMAQLLGLDQAAGSQPQTDLVPTAGGSLLSSQFGLSIYDRDAFTAQGFTDGNYDLNANVSAGTQGNQDTWLDTNSAPMLVNRYNGTLIRAE